MNTNYDNMSLFDIAYKITEESNDGYTINELLKLTLEAKGMDTSDVEVLTNLYIEICSSSKFVYLENKKWDLKTRHSLDEYDKDGSKFVDKSKVEEIDSDDTTEEYDDESEDDDEESEDDENDDDDSVKEKHYHSKEDNYDDSDDYGDDYSNDDSFDEEKYNSTMDDYEDEYDK